MQILEESLACRLDLAKESSAYDLVYISDSLAKCGSFQEKLSDLAGELTRMSLQIIESASGARGLLAQKEAELKNSTQYREMERDRKTAWLQEQLLGLSEDSEGWNVLKKVVSEVRDAVNERASTMKRLDSDIRLHSRLYEARVGVGASGHPIPPQTSGGEMVDLG